MHSAKTRGVGFSLVAAAIALASSSAHAQASEHGLLLVRLQLEPGALLARQNGPLTMALNSFGLTGSLAVGLNVSSSTAVGAEMWLGLAASPSLTITPPAFDGADDTVDVNGPSLMALLVGPNITHVFEQESFSVSVTAGLTSASFGEKGYAKYKPKPDYDPQPGEPPVPDCGVEPNRDCVPTLPYNVIRDPTGVADPVRTPIPFNKTSVGLGFGVALAKHFVLADNLSLGLGVQFRYLSVPDDAVYFDYSGSGQLTYRADRWSITSIGLNASVTYF